MLYGGGDQTIDFSYPNPQVMGKMRVTADAGLVQLENLTNANATEIWLKGDFVRYQVHFGGELKENSVLRVGIGVTRVDISLPASAALKITSGYAPVSGNPEDFTFANKAYWNQPARDHQEPLLHIMAPTAALGIHFSRGDA